MRISYRSDEGPLCVTDCMHERYWYLADQNCVYHEDGGKEWTAWEDNNETLRSSYPLY